MNRDTDKVAPASSDPAANAQRRVQNPKHWTCMQESCQANLQIAGYKEFCDPRQENTGQSRSKANEMVKSNQNNGPQAVENSADQDCDSTTTVRGNLLQYAFVN